MLKFVQAVWMKLKIGFCGQRISLRTNGMRNGKTTTKDFIAAVLGAPRVHAYVCGDANNNGVLDLGETWTYVCTATITAVEDTRVLVIDKTAFTGILAQNPSIVESLSRILENRLRELAQKKAEAQTAQQAAPVETFAVILKKIKKFFGI